MPLAMGLSRAVSSCVWLMLPESVKKIGSRAFANCKSLEILLIQSKDTITFGEDCPEDCGNLRIVASSALAA